VFIDGYWAWAPGPLVVRPVYAPALVAFFGAPGVRVTVGAPFVSWVALGWGEPVIPWWGSPRFVGRPWWAGWGGPRVVNNVVVNRTTIVNVQNITVYRNTNVHNAVVSVREDAFGRRGAREARVTDVDVRRLEPVRGRLHVTPDASSFVAGRGPAVKPPAQIVERRVVATRRPVARVAPPETGRERTAPAIAAPAPRIVPAPKAGATATAPRAPFGTSPIERERASTPPRFESRPEPRAEAPRPESRPEMPRPETPRPESRPEMARPEPTRPEMARPETPRPQPRTEMPRPEPRPDAGREVGRPREATPRALPGEPANRVSPWRRESTAPRPSTLAPGRATAPGPTRMVERDDARRTPPQPAAAHAERGERRARGR
jgi:hypothetical protein